MRRMRALSFGFASTGKVEESWMSILRGLNEVVVSSCGRRAKMPCHEPDVTQCVYCGQETTGPFSWIWSVESIGDFLALIKNAWSVFSKRVFMVDDRPRRVSLPTPLNPLMLGWRGASPRPEGPRDW